MSLSLANSRSTPEPLPPLAKIGNGRFFYPDFPNDPFTGVHFSGWVNDCWRVTKSYSYRTDSGEIWTVEHGFVTDFFSIPRAMQWFYPKVWSDANGAAGLHDWGLKRGINRRKCDRVLLTAMRDLGVSKARRWVVYSGVSSYTAYLELRGRA